MSATAFYTDIDSFCCDILRARVADGSLPPGVVEQRDIRTIHPDELTDYGQIHLFAGIGGGGLACRLAGVPDEFPLITAGVPCQPASQAGKRLGAADERWLWPEFFRLLRGLGSHYALVEQPPGIVSLNAGREWGDILGTLAEIREDLDVSRVSAADVGAPHTRERIWIVAYPDGQGRRERWQSERSELEGASRHLADGSNEGMGDATDGVRRAFDRGMDRGEGIETREASPRRVQQGNRCPWHDGSGTHGVPVRGYDGTVRLIPCEAAQARPESPLRALVDGFSRMVVGSFDGEENAKASQADRAEVVRALWGDDGAREDQWTARGCVCVCAEKILLAVVCEHARRGNAERCEAASGEAPESRLRKLWCDDEARCASHRREPAQQLARELADRVSRIPNALASRAAGAWHRYSRSRANLWPVTDGLPGRVARLRAIGNAWVPQAAVPALRVILAHASGVTA